VLTIEILKARAAQGDKFAAEAVRVYRTDEALQRAIQEADNG
jgi:phage tail protein X